MLNSAEHEIYPELSMNKLYNLRTWSKEVKLKLLFSHRPSTKKFIFL